MEPLGEALARVRARLPRAAQSGAADEASADEPPSCPICKDHGFVRREVELGHPDFGRAIACTCRLGEIRERLRRRSNLGFLSTRTFETFRTSGREPGLSGPQQPSLLEALEICRSYAEAPLAWLVLSGPSGGGKTHLAAAIANRQLELGNEVFFTVVPDLLDHLRATFGPGSDVTYDELFEEVRNCQLLILDDLGAQSETPWAQEKLFQVLNHRFNAELPTVITTTYALDQLDERLVARLRDKTNSRIVEVGERDTGFTDLIESDWTEGLRLQRFDNFRVDLPHLTQRQKKSLAYAFKAAADFTSEPRRWLVLVGEVGRGKTHLAAAIKNFLEENGVPVVFITVPRLLDHLRATYAPASPVTYDRAFDLFLNAPILVLDDYGTHSSAKPWAGEKLFQLINHRFNARLPTVITTNMPFDQPEQLPPADQQELRIFSRILDQELCQIVRIDSLHFRRPELDLKKRPYRGW